MENSAAAENQCDGNIEGDEIISAIVRLSADMDEMKRDLRFYLRKAESGITRGAYLGLERNAGDILSESYREEINGVMEIIAGDCPMMKKCSEKFSGILSDMITDYRNGELDDARAEDYRGAFADMRDSAPYPSCADCFDKNSDIMEKSIRKCESLHRLFACGAPEKMPKSPEEIDVESIVPSFLEPLANRHRFQVLQELYSGLKSFSELSETTGLRGGNLLFHLEKLIKTSMILQKQDRGVYVLSEKGAAALRLCTGMD